MPILYDGICKACGKSYFRGAGAVYCSFACRNVGMAKNSNYEFVRMTIAAMDYDRALPWQAYPCLPWERGSFNDGRGACKVGGKTIKVPRLVIELTDGKMADGLFACHHCDTPNCWHPAHLFASTAAGNSEDMVAKKRSARGGRISRAIFTEQSVVEMRGLYAAGLKISEIASRFQASHTAVSSVVHRKCWKYI